MLDNRKVGTRSTSDQKSKMEGSWIFGTLVTIGIFGCLLALFILSRIKRNSNNEKYRFMLLCLITIDCVELVFMLIGNVTIIYWPQAEEHAFMCCLFLILRFGGIASGILAIVMAVERWLAFTKPFFYEAVRTVLCL